MNNPKKILDKVQTKNQEPLINLSLVLVPSGEFWMGCPSREDGKENEKPQHLVSVESFLMGQTPITQEQWAVVAGWQKVVEDLMAIPGIYGRKTEKEKTKPNASAKNVFGRK